ncbi:uncharacterized protein PV07_11283 [Cladophialophora immunda]|uniref:Lipocalin-like domain-containing protein n=1 Tax=Cladophialophora immunda TaxID=569365 RepID=A0A0D1Z656_9EURO|nr:uncharacterized protein PV07_11283 [Cladophialophora immunda]KIW23051.1 hypothetical protein PV07_11283 [Cladophialophora immunda]
MSPATNIGQFRETLHGAWRLASQASVSTTNPQHKSYLLGPTATGFILYTPDGHMTATASANLPPIETVNPAAGLASLLSDAEAAACARSYISYAGGFELREISKEEDGEKWAGEKEKAMKDQGVWLGMLVHIVECSLFPNWVGTRQHRICSIDREGVLTLTAREGTDKDGETFRAIARWKKA